MDNDWTIDFVMKTDKGNLGTIKPIEIDANILDLFESREDKVKFILGEMEPFIESVMMDYEAKQ